MWALVACLYGTPRLTKAREAAEGTCEHPDAAIAVAHAKDAYVKHFNVYSLTREAGAGSEALSLSLTVKGAKETSVPADGAKHSLAAGAAWKVRQAFAFEEEITVELSDGTNTKSFTWKDPTPHTAGSFALGDQTVEIAFSVTQSAASFDERYVNIHSIRCEVSEEVGATEVYVVVKTPKGEIRFPNGKDEYVSLSNGQALEAKLSFPFDGEATVELWDEDDMGDDDPLGTFSVAALTDLARAELRMEAFFVVDYSVTDEIPLGFEHVVSA
jgi:hypothetical protein